MTLYVNLIYYILIYVFILFLYIMNFQEKYDILDKEILQAAKERNFKLKDEKVKIQKRIAYLLSLEKEIEKSDKRILELSKKWASNEDIEKEVLNQENLQFKFNISYKNEYNKVRDEVNGHRIVKGAEWCGLINWEWNEITEEKYDSVWNINKYGLAPFGKNWKYWLINKRWEVVAPNVYDRIHDFSDWFAVLEKDNKFGLMDTNWEIVLPVEYKYLSDVKNWNLLYGDEMNRNKKRSLWMMNVKWEILSVAQYGWFSELIDNWYAIVEKDGKKWLLNDNWELIIPIKYNEIVKSDVLKWWLIEVRVYDYWKSLKWKVTLEWKEYIPPIYDDILKMWWLEWAYKVILNAKDGFKFEWLIDKDGNLIVAPDKYFEILNFETKKDWRKFAEVRKYDKNVCRKFKWLIDAEWKEILPAVYWELVPSKKDDNIYTVSKKKFFGDYKYGYADLNGNDYFWKNAEKVESLLNLK